ncbi:unnamed protein product [Closterium sp. NIES-65]|nr:unnamed protein product [Closterium sp. NIES-65]
MRPGAVHQQPDEEEDGEEEEEDGEEGEEREEGEGNSEQYSRTRSKGPEGEEICRVLGGGVVLGSLVLVSGSPGAGKSTLLLQLAGLLAEEARGSLTGGSPLAVLYVSGEEREEQLATRAKRLGITADNLFLLSENNLESILEGITEIEPRAVIVDSIQTMHLPGVTGSLGSVSQVRECTLLLLLEAKNRGIPIFIVGHVTKAGDVAGPRDLKHIVDVVMHVEVSVTVTGATLVVGSGFKASVKGPEARSGCGDTRRESMSVQIIIGLAHASRSFYAVAISGATGRTATAFSAPARTDSANDEVSVVIGEWMEVSGWRGVGGDGSMRHGAIAPPQPRLPLASKAGDDG